MAVVNKIKRQLSKKPGVNWVELKKYDKKDGHAIFWVRTDGETTAALGEYLRQIEDVNIKVYRSDLFY
jgi:ATP:corrinoid adenosyltransferase